MTSNLLVYPRYLPAAFNDRLRDLRRLSEADDVLPLLRSLDEPVIAPALMRAPAPTVEVNAADEHHLEALQAKVRTLADDHGFPEARSNGDPKWASFDRRLAALLRAEMAIWRADAGAQEVWMHLGAWLLPDVNWWRWGQPKAEKKSNGSPADSPRWGGGPRWWNRGCFSRLWWRAELLGDVYLSGDLLEDAIVQIFERSSISGCRPLVQSIAIAWGDTEIPPGVDHEDLFRDFILRMRRQMGLRCIYVMSSKEMEGLASDELARSTESLVALVDQSR